MIVLVIKNIIIRQVTSGRNMHKEPCADNHIKNTKGTTESNASNTIHKNGKWRTISPARDKKKSHISPYQRGLECVLSMPYQITELPKSPIFPKKAKDGKANAQNSKRARVNITIANGLRRVTCNWRSRGRHSKDSKIK